MKKAGRAVDMGRFFVTGPTDGVGQTSNFFVAFLARLNLFTHTIPMISFGTFSVRNISTAISN